MQRDEKQLILLLRDESTRREAFAEVVRTYQEPLYRMVRRIVLIHEDADDVLQNTFIKAWQGLDKFRGDSSLGTWLYRIASHEALDHLERNKRLCASIDDDEHPGHMSLASRLESDPYFDGDETQQQLQQAIRMLPDKQRAVFNMKYFEEMKFEEISEVFGTSVGALKASYHFAVKKITAYFESLD